MSRHSDASRVLCTILAAAVTITAVGLTGCRIPKGPPEPMGPRYVRVEKINGRYWFVRRSDRFLAIGVNAVVPEDHSKPKDGRRYNVLPKYNNDVAAWAKDAAARLKLWSFNTFAGWCHDYLYENFPIYHTRVLWLGPWGHNDGRLIDVFSESYAADVDRTCRKEVAPHATNEYLIGYFINNELPWYGERGWPTSPNVSMITRYMRLPEKAPGKVRLVELLRSRYAEDFQAFTANWEVSATNFDELARARQAAPKNRQARKDTVAWSGVVADQYFKLCAETIRRYDANHLLLGARFAERAQEPVMAACGKYCDVISVNHYRKTGIFDSRQVGAIAALAGKPVMITEYSWRALENSSGCPSTRGADVTVKTQQDRADCFRRYAREALAQPFIVGMDWFCYHDQPPAGRFDGENSNYGLVDINDQFYTALLGAITEVNAQAMQIHELSQVPMPAYEPNVLADYKEITIPAAPAPAPTVFVDATSAVEPWGDFANGAEIKSEPDPAGGLLLSGKPVGWGCGLTYQGAASLPKNPDGSVNLLGAQKIIVVLDAPAGLKFSAGLDESGIGPTDSQTFAGHNGADGELYNHGEIVATGGRAEYVFEMSNLEPSPNYGNQRGNYIVDTAAIKAIHLFFPNQESFEVRLDSIRVE